MKTKKCIKCKEEKELTLFSKSKATKDGHIGCCKSCVNTYKKQYRQNNKEQIDAKAKEYYQANREEIAKKAKEHYQANKEERAKKAKEWYQENKEYYQANKEERAKKAKEYYQANKEKMTKRSIECTRNRMKTDPLFKLTHNTRALIGGSFKNASIKKGSKTANILGCDFEELQTWLYSVSKVFPETDTVNMDHVIPISLATTESEVIALNHYSNFQWLTGDENMAKGNRFIESENLDRVLSNHPNPELLELMISRSKLQVV